jgi:hypothetical protein
VTAVGAALQDQAEPTLAATVEMLAAGILSGFARRGSEPDAAFKAAFRLGCVAAVNITGEHRLAVVAQPGVDADVERRVKVAVFADAERKEAEAAAVCALPCAARLGRSGGGGAPVCPSVCHLAGWRRWPAHVCHRVLAAARGVRALTGGGGGTHRGRGGGRGGG